MEVYNEINNEMKFNFNYYCTYGPCSNAKAYELDLISTPGGIVKSFDIVNYDVHTLFNKTFDLPPLTIFCSHTR